ncbi:MAG: cytochrome c biogenesis protein CcsA [Dysgonamonadaceae bacterium]|jgi:cytochrome c-type biogenesis protein CcsB|nr:cytochrome c biogenesis protein CcsA [Dysgonamonadaceae bacterium]
MKIINSLYRIILLFLLTNLSIAAQSKADIYNLFQTKTILASHAATFGALPLQTADGRFEPVNTFSSEILRKLHHSDKIGNLSSEQFLLSLLTMPEMWMHVPFIYIKNKEISKHYGLPERQIAYIEIFDDNGDYRLQKDVDAAFSKPPSARSKFDKDLLKLNEQIHIFSQLANREMLNLFPVPDDKNHSWTNENELLPVYLSAVADALQKDEWKTANSALQAIAEYQAKNSTLKIDNKKLQAELLYNRLNIFAFCKKFYFVLGAHLFVFAFVFLFKQKKSVKIGIVLQTGLIAAVLAYHLFGIILRSYISGYAPWTNAYETMVYVGLVTVAAGLIFARKSAITVALATLFGGVILFVSGLNWLDPQISPLAPVLNSPWLMIHVAVIVAAYGFFGVSFLLGITNLILFKAIKSCKYIKASNQLTVINELSLWAGLAFMTIGTFVGAVWANESWGRYWGWDPKETWALITLVVYAIALHLRLIKQWDSPTVLNWASVLAFASVLMTYFGVNYYLTGMHSYGS